MLVVCLSLVVISLALSLPLTAILIRVGRRLGQLDQPGEASHKQHKQATPHTGGMAIFVAVALPLLVVLLTVWISPWESWSGWLAPVRPHIKGLRTQSPMAIALLVGMAILHVLGLIDDRRGLGPYVKLAVQFVVAAVLALLFDMRVLHFLQNQQNQVFMGTAVSVCLSILWILAIINAMNFLDNMDGLAGGVGAIIAGLYLAATLINGQWFVAALAALVLGALLGFLVFNFPPARVFMGDAGSLVLGLLMAVLSIRTTYFHMDLARADSVPTVGSNTAWYGLLMPLLVMAVPVYDLISVTLIRLFQGRSPFVGDQQHFSHRLVGRGLTARSAVMVIWLCTLATGLGGVMLGQLEGWQAALVGIQAALVITVLALLEWANHS